MSSKQRSCCCDGPSAQPCCALFDANILFDFDLGETLAPLHFTGFADPTSLGIGDGIYPRIVTSNGYATTGGFPGDVRWLTESADRGSALDTGVGWLNPQQISINTSVLRFPQCSGVRKPLRRTLYNRNNTAPSFISADHLPYCGYAAFQTTIIESSDLISGSFGHDTVGIFIVVVSPAQSTVNGIRYYSYAAKVTSWEAAWIIEPWRPTTTSPTQFEVLVRLKPKSATWYPSTPITMGATFPTGFFNIDYQISFSLTSTGTGNGCPFGLQYLPAGSSLTNYRGTVRACRIPYTPALVPYPASYSAPCLQQPSGGLDQYLSQVTTASRMGATGSTTPIFFPTASPNRTCLVSVP